MQFLRGRPPLAQPPLLQTVGVAPRVGADDELFHSSRQGAPLGQRTQHHIVRKNGPGGMEPNRRTEDTLMRAIDELLVSIHGLPKELITDGESGIASQT